MNLFFFFSKILTVFLFPLPLGITLGIYLVLFKIKGAKNKFLAFLPIGLIWLAASFPVCESLVSSLEKHYPPLPIENVEQADTIVVLGGMINLYQKNPRRKKAQSHNPCYLRFPHEALCWYFSKTGNECNSFSYRLPISSNWF